MGKQAAQSGTNSSFNQRNEQSLIVKTKMGIRSKDTSDIKSTPSPLKSCILIPSPNGFGGRVNVKKSKSVHFADSLGKPLKSIKTLYSCDDELDMALLSVRFQQQTIGGKTQNTFPAIDTLTNNLINKQNHCSTQKSKLLNFELPNINELFTENVKLSNVLLENLIFRETGIFATVTVHNIAYEKSVFVNYTVDNWATVLKTAAKYVPGSNTGMTDTFSFEINVLDTKQRSNNEEIEIQFAVCYICGGDLYWDSNGGKNYHVLFRKPKFNKNSEPLENYHSFIIPKQKFIGWAS